ncbi:MAG: porin [Acidobacteriota bacterium]
MFRRAVDSFVGLPLLIAAACALLCLAPDVSADGWTAKWSNGFKVDSEDGSFKLKFGGRIMADYTFVDADDSLVDLTEGDGFEFRRARFFFSGTIYDRVFFKANYDFADGDADFKDVYIGLHLNKADLFFGHFFEPFSLEQLTSSKYIAFLERSLNNAFVPERNSGVALQGYRGDKLDWGFGVFYDADGFGVSTDEDNINVTGRVSFRPLYEDDGKRMLHVGLSATQKDRASSIRFRARPEAHFSDRFVDTGSFAADDAFIYGLEVAGVHNAFWFASEYTQADVSTPGSADPSFDGGYVQFGYYLGGKGDYRRFKTKTGTFDRQKPKDSWGKEGGKGAWEIAFRYSTIDLNDGGVTGGEMDDWTLGLNWYPNPATRLLINWVHADVDQVGEADFFLVRWQVDF